MRALRNLQEEGIPFRFNTVLTRDVVPQLSAIAKLAVATGALCVNWLGFNPHEDQVGKENSNSLMPSFHEMRDPLTEALDILGEAGIETNVRYVPHCMVADRHRGSIYHFQQLFYDHREWDLASWAWTTLRPQREWGSQTSKPVALSSLWWWVCFSTLFVWMSRIPGIGPSISIKRLVDSSWIRQVLYRVQRFLPSRPGAIDGQKKAALYNRVARLHAQMDCDVTYAQACRRCTAKRICSGIYKDYARVFGTTEVQAIAGSTPIADPPYYIRLQRKLVEKEDEGWALVAGDQ